MKILGAGVPVFLGQAGVGQNFGQIAPQIRFFDVYYIHPPVVGLQITGVDPETEASVFGLQITSSESP